MRCDLILNAYPGRRYDLTMPIGEAALIWHLYPLGLLQRAQGPGYLPSLYALQMQCIRQLPLWVVKSHVAVSNPTLPRLIR